MTAPRTVVNEGVTKVGYLTVGGNDNDYKLSRPKGPTGTEGGSVVSASASMSYLGALSLPAAQLDSALRDGHTPLSRTALSSQERQPPASLVDAAAAEQARLRRQISHDIHHELSTIMLLASLLEAAPDVGADSRERARQLLGETRWLHQLHRAYEESVVSADSAVRSSVEPVRLDLLAGEVVAAMQLSTLTRIGFTVQEAWAHVDRLEFWRGLRNLVGNAVRAAGAAGRVEVRITTDIGWAVAEVDDNGPGFGAAPNGRASLGLGIVQDLASAWGGELEIRRGVLGGCCVRLRLPWSSPAEARQETGEA